RGHADAAGGAAGSRSAYLGNAGAGLMEQLRRGAAQLHRGVELKLDATVRFGGDFLGPRLEEVDLGERMGREEVVNLEGDFGFVGLGPSHDAGSEQGQQRLREGTHFNVLSYLLFG